MLLCGTTELQQCHKIAEIRILTYVYDNTLCECIDRVQTTNFRSPPVIHSIVNTDELKFPSEPVSCCFNNVRKNKVNSS
ncbi:hypothetical protein J6590_053769 [Homalodisca vitripennis]|nr:hypothetical protein J6590_053769 [Homalodisca vitripennis]